MGNGPTTQDILAERSHGTMSAEMAVLRLLLCHRDLEKTAQELAAIDSGPARKWATCCGPGRRRPRPSCA